VGALPSSFIPDETDEIIQQLDDDLDPFAKLAALFERVGAAGTMWEHFRKIKLASISERIREEYLERGEKITDGRCDTLAHCHPEYIAFVKRGLAQKEVYHEKFNRRIEHYISLRELSNKGIR